MSETIELGANVQDLMWGTYGKGGVEHCLGTCPLHQFRWKRLVDCETEHLQKILSNQRHVDHNPTYKMSIHAILIQRGVVPNAFSKEAEDELYRNLYRAKKH